MVNSGCRINACKWCNLFKCINSATNINKAMCPFTKETDRTKNWLHTLRIQYYTNLSIKKYGKTFKYDGFWLLRPRNSIKEEFHKQKITLECTKKGHQYEQTLQYHLDLKYNECSVCHFEGGKSGGERRVEGFWKNINYIYVGSGHEGRKNLLSSDNNCYATEVKWKNLKFKKELRVDFLVKTLEPLQNRCKITAIEYDGFQHFYALSPRNVYHIKNTDEYWSYQKKKR